MITTDVGGLRETIGERGTGVIIDNGEPATIARAIVDYFSPENAGMREEMVLNIRREKERLSWGTFCNKLEDFYKTL